MLKGKKTQGFYANGNPINGAENIIVAVINGSVLVPLDHQGNPKRFLLCENDCDQFKALTKESILLGQWHKKNCYVWELEPEAKTLPGYELVDLRHLLIDLSDSEFCLVSRAVQLLRWRQAHQFCSGCAASLSQCAGEQAMRCNHCDVDYYPRISPCIIVIVVHQDKCLLARQAKWPPGRYSALAGFMEAGESAEQAIIREVYEEVGIEVEDIRYVGSQSWPFPSQLMLGYIATAKSTTLRVDGEEISEAQWWQYDQLPEFVPPPTIMAGRLIEAFLEAVRK